MADETPGTSHAKSVDLDYQKNDLDRALKLKQQFDRAKAAHDKSLEEKARDSGRVEGHAPRAQQHLRPQGPTRVPVDREIDKEQHSKEDQRARALENQKKLMALEKQRDRDNEKER
jgi:hypothetical protein